MLLSSLCIDISVFPMKGPRHGVRHFHLYDMSVRGTVRLGVASSKVSEKIESSYCLVASK